MDFNLSAAERELQARAKDFAETWLFPHEEQAEEPDGVAPETMKKILAASVDYKLSGMNHSVEDGGRGYNVVQQCLIYEELGKATGGLALIPSIVPPYSLKFATPEQKDKYLRPTINGDMSVAFMVSEKDAGSDARAIKTSAVKKGSNYVVNGEKWFASHADEADYSLLHSNIDGDPEKATLFIVDKGTPGMRIKHLSKHMLNRSGRTPQILLENMEIDEGQILGGIGQGFELTKDWFIEQRMFIASRCVGSAIRAAETAEAYARERVAFGQKVADFQAIEFKIADMAVDIMTAKTLLYRCASEIDGGIERKLAHARAAAVKLVCSEMAGRVCDEALQIMGGRGYLVEYPTERLYRSVRLERIVEGTSEIQRVVIGGQIKKRGLGLYTSF
jgi:acyl-CoA dehydrogenase